MAAACDLISVELRLDRIEAELAAELPPHMRTFAHAYARGAALPPAPDALRRPMTLATARAALAHPLLADRGLALLRLVAPVAIEDDPGVSTARAAAPSWDALAALAVARDRAAQARFACRAVDLMHRLHGAADAMPGMHDAPAPGAASRSTPHSAAGEPAATHGGVVLDPAAAQAAALPPAVAGRAKHDGTVVDPTAVQAPALPPAVVGWAMPDGVVIDPAALRGVVDAICARHGVAGSVRLVFAERARPRMFAVQPRHDVILVLPASIATPADRFAVLHEAGHAVAALALPAGIPRVLDEAVAAYVARAIERPGDSPAERSAAEAAWASPAAANARVRRLALARRLDQLERALPAIPPPGDRIAERPPWALWHDPGAQAAYVAAEARADAIALEVGPAPAPGVLARVLAAHRDRIDRVDLAL